MAVGAADASVWTAHGIAYPHAGARLTTLEESLRVVRSLWRTADGFTPIQHPAPPIWIAAMRPRALALTARCADGWEASYVSPADFTRCWHELSALLRAEGRATES